MLRPTLVGTLLAFASVASLGDAQSSPHRDTLAGTLDYVFPHAEKAPEIVWSIVQGGRRYTLDLPAEIVHSAGGLSGLAGRKVQVSGRLSGNTFQVQKIGWQNVPDKLVPSPVSGPVTRSLKKRPQVFILAKFKDTVPIEPHPKSWYEQLAYGSGGSVRDYYWEQSNGQWDLSGSVVTDWVVLPRNKADYLLNTPVGIDSEAVIKDALAAADPQVDYRQFDGLHVILNTPAGNEGGDGGKGTFTLDGETRVWGRTFDAYPDFPVLFHEIGHSFGFDHSSGGYDTQYDSRWDDMSAGGTPNRYHPDYGIIPPHTNAYHRMMGGILSGDQIKECLPGTNATIHLSRMVQPEAGKYQAARIFLGGDGARWLTIEARKRVGYYEAGATLVDEGVVMHDCDPTHWEYIPWIEDYGPGPVSYVLDVDRNKDPNDAAAIWKPGETYTDAANGVTVSVVKETAAGFDVKVTVDPRIPSPLIVTNANDHGPGSLRSAIAYANLFPGSTIKFAAPKAALTKGELLIQPITPFPPITAAKTVIDGTSQTVVGDTNPGMPEVAIDGKNLAGWGHGIMLAGDKQTVMGISARNMPSAGIFLSGATAAVVSGCAVGTDSTGTIAAPNGWIGMVAENGSKVKVIDLLASGNVWGGFLARNITGLSVLGGKFGTDRAGSDSLGNDYNGLSLENVTDSSVGPNGTIAPVVSGSVKQDGIGLTNCSSLKFTNLRVGVNLAGDAAIPNAGTGAWIQGGKDISMKACQFSGNTANGIVVTGGDATGTTFSNCLFGTDSTGAKPLGNGGSGVWVDAAGVTLVGCALSGNKANGAVLYHGAIGTIVKSCKLGTDKLGSTAVPNGQRGIAVDQAQNWEVLSCVLSANGGEGIATYNGAGPGRIADCLIGLGSHNEKLGSPVAGIWISGNSHDIRVANDTIANNGGFSVAVGLSTGITIAGGKVSDGGNVGVAFFQGASLASLEGTEIRRCKSQAVLISDAATHDIVVTGVLADKNEWAGIAVANGAHHCRIDGNTLLGYTGCGIALSGGAHDNAIVSNAVGCRPTSPAMAANDGAWGIGLWGGSYNNAIGMVGTGNLIGPGRQIGVGVNDADTVGNPIRGNVFMGTVGLAIDLGSDGRDTNDADDADSGPNRKQNGATLTKDGDGKIKIAYQGAPSRKIMVDLYAVDPKRDAGWGPGFTYLGTVTLATSATGKATGAFAAPANTAKVTAVATDKATGDSGEFSANLALL